MRGRRSICPGTAGSRPRSAWRLSCWRAHPSPGLKPPVAGAAPREVQKALGRILDRRQRARLAQIALQREGLWAILRPEIAAQLDLRPEQSELIRMILEQLRAAEAQSQMARPWRTMAVPDLDEA